MYLMFTNGAELSEFLAEQGYDYSEEICQDFLDTINPNYDIGNAEWVERDELEKVLASSVAEDIENFLEGVETVAIFTPMQDLTLYMIHEEVYNRLFRDK